MGKKTKITEIDDDLGIIEGLIKDVPKEHVHFIERASEVTEQICKILSKKGWKQKELAEKMGKSESEMSRILSGTHNFTFKMLSHIEVVLNENIFFTEIGKEFENENLQRKEHKFYSSVNNTYSRKGKNTTENMKPASSGEYAYAMAS